MNNPCPCTNICADYPISCAFCGINIDNLRDKRDSLYDITITYGGRTYRASEATLNESYNTESELEVTTILSPYNMIQPESLFEPLAITNVIFNPPATIVFWSDNTKTVVRCDESLEPYDPEKGIAMAISRKMLADNKRDYYNVFKHWLKKWNKYKKAQEQVERDKNLVDHLEKCFEEEENN